MERRREQTLAFGCGHQRARLFEQLQRCTYRALMRPMHAVAASAEKGAVRSVTARRILPKHPGLHRPVQGGPPKGNATCARVDAIRRMAE
jgi:hypothetical protein